MYIGCRSRKLNCYFTYCHWFVAKYIKCSTYSFLISIDQYMFKINSKLGLECNVITNLYFVTVLKTDEAPSTCLLFVQKGGLQMMAQALKVLCFKITTMQFTFYMSVMPEYTSTVIISLCACDIYLPHKNVVCNSMQKFKLTVQVQRDF